MVKRNDYRRFIDLQDEVLASLRSIREKYHNVPLMEEDKEKDEQRPAYFIILGYDSSKHSKHVFNGTKHELIDSYITGNLDGILEQLKFRDGAILINCNGKIERVGAWITNINPQKLLKHSGEDIYKKLGFAHDIGTRHVSALYSSDIMPETRVYTLSGSSGDIRVYKKGEIIESTIKEELKNNLEALVAA